MTRQLNVEKLTVAMDKFGTMGSAIGLCFIDGNPTHTHFSYDEGFLFTYQAEDLASEDPTLAFGMQNDGITTWRELCPDPNKNRSMRLAHGYGLKDGVCFAVTVDGIKSIASLAVGENEMPSPEVIAEIYDLMILASFEVSRASKMLVKQSTQEWLGLATKGLTDHEIAVELGITLQGAQKRRKTSIEDLGAKTPAHAIARAHALGVLRGYPFV